MIRRSFKILLCMLAFTVTACEKNAESSVPKRLLYADSIFYLKSGSAEQIAYPLERRAGKYSSFPFGLVLDERTGAINVSKSETGLRYMVFFDGEDGRSDSGTIVLSGINYPDHYYILAKGD